MVTTNDMERSELPRQTCYGVVRGSWALEDGYPSLAYLSQHQQIVLLSLITPVSMPIVGSVTIILPMRMLTGKAGDDWDALVHQECHAYK